MADSSSMLTTKLQDAWIQIQLRKKAPETKSINMHAAASASGLEEQKAMLNYIDNMLMEDEEPCLSTELGVGIFQAELAHLLDSSTSRETARSPPRASWLGESSNMQLPDLRHSVTWPARDRMLEQRNHGLNRLWQQLGLGAGSVRLLEKLMLCAEAVSAGDFTTAWQCVGDIRQEAGLQGNAVQRVSFYFLEALLAKMSGTGVQMFTTLSNSCVPRAVRLRALKMLLGSAPFLSLPYLFANKIILEAVRGVRKVHIMDFGIVYGEQWPRLFQLLAERDEGPPEIRITGINLPVPGFKPSSRIDETGCSLTECASFWGVPFRYQSLSTRWEKVQLDVQEDEVLIVNAMFKQANLFDETVLADSAKNQWLRRVSSLRPKVVIQGVASADLSSPIFIARFQEALLHHIKIFAAMEKCIPTQVAEKTFIERGKYAKEIMNIVACDCSDRVERTETYQQWHSRAEKAGLESLPFSEELFDECFKLGQRYGLTVDRDGDWMKLGLEHQVVHAYSAWQPRRSQRKRLRSLATAFDQ